MNSGEASFHQSLQMAESKFLSLERREMRRSLINVALCISAMLRISERLLLLMNSEILSSTDALSAFKLYFSAAARRGKSSSSGRPVGNLSVYRKLIKRSTVSALMSSIRMVPVLASTMSCWNMAAKTSDLVSSTSLWQRNSLCVLAFLDLEARAEGARHRMVTSQDSWCACSSFPSVGRSPSWVVKALSNESRVRPSSLALVMRHRTWQAMVRAPSDSTPALRSSSLDVYDSQPQLVMDWGAKYLIEEETRRFHSLPDGVITCTEKRAATPSLEFKLRRKVPPLPPEATWPWP